MPWSDRHEPGWSGNFGASLRSQHTTGALADFGDDLGGERVDFRVSQGFLARLDRDRNRDRPLAGFDAFALLDVKD